MSCDESRIESGFRQFIEADRGALVAQHGIEDGIIVCQDGHDVRLDLPPLPDFPVVVAVLAADAAELFVCFYRSYTKIFNLRRKEPNGLR